MLMDMIGRGLTVDNQPHRKGFGGEMTNTENFGSPYFRRYPCTRPPLPLRYT